MRKLLLAAIVAFALLAPGRADAQTDAKLGLPELNVIKQVSLSPCYSCRSAEEVGKGYQQTALFLSAFSKSRNAPDVLFNGAFGSGGDYFIAATAGDDMSLIADLGAGVALEDLSGLRAFNLRRVASDEAFSKFAQQVKVEANHTYAVVLNNVEKRGLVLFTVNAYVPHERVDLSYAVKSYQVNTGQRFRSEGFQWDRGNTKATSQK